MNYFHIVAVRLRSSYTHNNGTYSDFPLEPLWMDRENRKPDLAFQSRRTSQVPYNSVHHRWFLFVLYYLIRRSQWPLGLRRRSAAARLLRLWVRIPPGAWIFVCCECCVLSGRGLCDELITRPEESYRLWCVVVLI